MSEEQYAYKYYTNGFVPIRAVMHDDTIVGTEIPNKETGEIERSSYWFMKVFDDRSGDIEEITKEKFDHMVIAFLAQKKTEAKPPPEVNGMA